MFKKDKDTKGLSPGLEAAEGGQNGEITVRTRNFKDFLGCYSEMSTGRECLIFDGRITYLNYEVCLETFMRRLDIFPISALRNLNGFRYEPPDKVSVQLEGFAERDYFCPVQLNGDGVLKEGWFQHMARSGRCVAE